MVRHPASKAGIRVQARGIDTSTLRQAPFV